MKKILIFSIIISVLTSCYDEFRLDNEFSAVAFSNATGGSNEQGVLWRTVVKDEGLKLNAGVYLAGILDNEKEISRVYIPLQQKVSIHNKNSWRDVMEFFNEKMSLFEAFFEAYKDIIEG